MESENFLLQQNIEMLTEMQTIRVTKKDAEADVELVEKKDEIQKMYLSASEFGLNGNE